MSNLMRTHSLLFILCLNISWMGQVAATTPDVEQLQHSIQQLTSEIEQLEQSIAETDDVKKDIAAQLKVLELMEQNLQQETDALAQEK